MDKIFLISYDITADKLRQKVANKLIYYGFERVQYSVFMGSIRPTLWKEAEQWLQQHIVGKDRLLILPLPPQIDQNALSFGEASIPWTFILNRQNTLYIE